MQEAGGFCLRYDLFPRPQEGGWENDGIFFLQRISNMGNGYIQF